MKRSILTLALLTVIFAGCSSDYRCRVESDTDWTANFGHGSIKGLGDEVIALPGDAAGCITVQKTTVDGFLVIQILERRRSIVGDDPTHRALETQAPYGALTDCCD